MKINLVAIGIVVGAAICGSIVQFAKNRTVWRLLQLLGAACLGIVVLTHFAEAFYLVPKMGWGKPNSAGHYLDLISALLGLIFLPSGFACATISERKNSK